MRRRFFNIKTSFITAICAGSFPAYADYAKNANEKDTASSSFAQDSYRMSLDLKTPRRYATRFLPEKRTLQIRISPAKSSEFDNTSYYDTRYINRVLVQEKLSEVILSIQLKNFPMSWLVASQNDPWRIVVDFWRSEAEPQNLEEEWNWQPSFIAASALKVDTKLEKSAPVNSDVNVSMKVASVDLKNRTEASKKYTDKPIPTVPVNTDKNSEKIPEIYSRLDMITRISDANRAELEKKIGNSFGSNQEFSAAKDLANTLYVGGEHGKSLVIYRNLAAINEQQFANDDTLLWRAGESAFLNQDYDLANDYFRTLLVNQPGSHLASFAKLRLVDIDELTHSKNLGRGPVGKRNFETYSSMALKESNPEIIKIAATLRALDGVVETTPDAVKIYQQNLDRCVTSRRVPFDLLKNCAYDRSRYLAKRDNISSADNAVQYFKKLSPKDRRAENLEVILQERVKAMLAQTQRDKTWVSWVAFEKQARPALLAFSFTDAKALFTRAEAFRAVGDNQKSVQLYESFLKVSSDSKKRNEAAAVAALMLFESDRPKKANEFLKRIEQDSQRKSDGLTDRCLSALRDLTMPPYRNQIALSVVMDEVKLGRYEEKTLNYLFEWSKVLRGKPEAELVYTKILAYPAKSNDEIQIVETSIMHFADDLREAERFSLAGDMFFALANLSQGTRHAETAYKAGVVYARAGLFEKAKAAWMLAANDTNDKRYSALASERLDRINK